MCKLQAHTRVMTAKATAETVEQEKMTVITSTKRIPKKRTNIKAL